MGIKDDLDVWVSSVFNSQWETRDGTKVPDDESKLGLKNEAIKIQGTVLYADLADSTQMVDSNSAPNAPERPDPRCRLGARGSTRCHLSGRGRPSSACGGAIDASPASAEDARVTPSSARPATG